MPMSKKKDGCSDKKSEEDGMCGLKLCGCCIKENEEVLKYLNVIVSLRADIKEIRESIKKNEDRFAVFEQQSKEIADLKSKLDSFTRDSKQATREWSSLFKDKVELLVSDVGSVQKSVEATKSSFEISSDRLNRKNNIVIYNLPERESKNADKEEILKLMLEITGRDFKDELEVLRLGRRYKETKKTRPVLVKFNNLCFKNLVFENSFKLRKSETFSRVILNNDLSKEDRELCSKLLREKKEEISKKDDVSKWVFRVRGQTGDYHVVSYRRQNL